MESSSASISLISSAFYWKKPLLGHGYWSKCFLHVLENGLLLWKTDKKSKGTALLMDIYDKIELVHADERRFFNAIPFEVPVAPYVLLIPIVRTYGLVENICFVFSSENELLEWLRILASMLHATDLLDEEKKRAAKEMHDASAHIGRDLMKLVIPSAWYHFKNALKRMDGLSAVRLSWKDV